MMKNWIAVPLVLLSCSISLAEKKDKKKKQVEEVEQQVSEEGLKEALLGEMGNLAKALRSLDQSYTFRGIRGCGSCTAGSVFIDWEAKGIEQPQRIRVLPPAPLNLSGRPLDHCTTCGELGERCEDCKVKHPGSMHHDHGHAHERHHAQNGHHRGHQHHSACQGCSSSKGHMCNDCSRELIAQARKDHAFTISLCIDTHKHHCETFHPLMSLSKDWSRANLAVGQVGHDVRLRILTSKRDEFDSLYHEICLGELGCGQHRIALEFDHGKLWICVNGSETAFLKLPGNLSNWK